MVFTTHVCAGFNLYLEHLLPYSGESEKARMPTPPLVTLGGGAWNILKTLSELDSKLALQHVALSSTTDARAATQKELLAKEKIRSLLLPAKKRIMSSYYLAPVHKPIWAFGDNGGGINLGESLTRHMAKVSNSAWIRILAEIQPDKKEVALAKLFFTKKSPEQINILIPSPELVIKKGVEKLAPDVLVVNEEESRLLFGKEPSEADILAFRTPTILITRAEKSAWLKFEGRIYSALPKKTTAYYFNGAGDTAAAALIYSLYIKRTPPLNALNFAMSIARKKLALPTPYYVTR
jgi:hypothetical protein